MCLEDHGHRIAQERGPREYIDLLVFQKTHEINPISSGAFGQAETERHENFPIPAGPCERVPAGAQSLQAGLACRLTSTDYVYHCTISLLRNGRPLAGEYEAKLDLEMLGEWAVKLRLGGPVKDQLVLLYDFDEKGATPVTRSGTAPRK